MKKVFTFAVTFLLLGNLAACGNWDTPVVSTPSAQETTTTATTTTTVAEIPETVDAVEAGAVTFKNPEVVFDKGTKVTAEAVNRGTIYERAKTAVSAVAKNFTVYEFNAVKDDVKVQPNGKLPVTFQIPAEYTTNVAVYYVAEDGTSEKLTATVIAASRTVHTQLPHFSTYVLVDLGGEETSTTTAMVKTTLMRTTPAAMATTTKKPTTTTTNKPATTTAPTTTAKPTTTTVTTTTAKPTTTTKALPPAVGSVWERVAVNGDDIEVYTLDFAQNCYAMAGGATAMKMLGSQEEIDNMYKEDPESFYTYQGVQYIFGMGNGCEITLAESGKTVTVTDEAGKTCVLNRESENTLTVTAQNSEIFDFAVGTVFTKQ